jgi:hypothetical protein
LWFVLSFAVAATMVSLISFLFSRNKLISFAFIVFSFSVLGFVTGSIMSDSQEPAVTAVLPATLTLLGGLGAYIIGFTHAAKQSVTSSIVFCFAVALFVGSIYGSWIRDDIKFSYEDNEKYFAIPKRYR